MCLGVLLFLAGVYFALGLSGTVTTPLGRSVALYPVPFALTIAGGALTVYANEAWYQHPDGPGGRRRRRERLRNLPSLEVYRPVDPPSRPRK